MKKVVGLGPVPAEIVQPILGEAIRFIEEPIESDLEIAEGAIVRANFRFNHQVFEKMPNLKAIARTGVGTDLVDLNIADKRKIPVIITPGSNTVAVAEGTFAHLLTLSKRIKPFTKIVAEDKWNLRDQLQVGDLEGNNIGIIGYGRIGKKLCEFANAFSMNIKVFDPFAQVEEKYKTSFNELLRTSDYISLHIPLTKENENLLNAEAFSMMKDGVIIVNCSRGGLINLDDALAALNSGKIGGIGLDTFDFEPPRPHPIFQNENVTLTPHVMGLSKRSTLETFQKAAIGIRDVLEGRAPESIANLKN